MAIRIGINGFGRIGKQVCRLALSEPNLKVVHINDKMNSELMAHLLRYDSIHGQYLADIQYDSDSLTVDGQRIAVTNCSLPEEIAWRDNGVDIVVDSCGKFKKHSALEPHLRNGAKKVILSCPPDEPELTRAVVLGVNGKSILPSDRIISNTSCTTNCAAVTLKVLIDAFGVRRAFMNTVHPMTNNQNIQDGFHGDFRRARAAINNIIPTTSSAITTVPIVLPELAGIFDGFATRVPVPDCSFVEITAQLNTKVTPEIVNKAYETAANGALNGILSYCTAPIVSSDINNDPHSAIFDALATKVIGGDLVQILAWYDNECGYSARIIDLIKHIS